MNQKPLSKIKLLKEIQVAQESPSGMMMVYTCYEAIPNGGFCILSATPCKDGKIHLKRSSYINTSKDTDINLPTMFFPTLIDAINAYPLESITSCNAG